MTVTMTVAEWLWVIGSCVFAMAVLLISVGRLLIAQIDKRLDARFSALEEQRRDGQTAWQALFAEHIRHDERELGAINSTLSALSANLSGHYVRKDEVRGIVGDDMEEKFDLIIKAINETKGGR